MNDIEMFQQLWPFALTHVATSPPLLTWRAHSFLVLVNDLRN